MAHSRVVRKLLPLWIDLIPKCCIEWIRSDFHKRKAHVEILLESLEHRDAEIRFTNARRLFYVLQGAFLPPYTYFHILTTVSLGTFAETTSPEHQLHWIFENCKVVRAANGLSTIVEAMKIAGSKHDLLWWVTRAYIELHSDLKAFLPRLQ